MIRLQNISKVYGKSSAKTIALDGVTITIESGGFVAIMGPSGSGKSTLLHILGIIDEPTEGEYFLDDTLVNNLSTGDCNRLRAAKIGYIFQQFALINEFTVRENVEIPLKAAKIKKNIRSQKIDEVLDKFAIKKYKNKYPNELSGGEQQRVAIARAVITDCDVLLADEPTGALDSYNTELLMDYFVELHKMGKTICVVTHDDTVASYAHQIVHLKDGRIESIDDRRTQE